MVTQDKSNLKYVSFSGPSCSGKTTLIEHISINPNFNGWYIVPSHTRQLKSEGFKINLNGDDKTQIKVLDIHHMNYLNYQCENRSYISDRCILDGLVYTEWLNYRGKVSTNVVNYAKAIFDEISEKINTIFYCNPVPWKDDGDRKLSLEDHIWICDKFQSYVSKLPNVVNLEGSIEKRLTIIDNHLK